MLPDKSADPVTPIPLPNLAAPRISIPEPPSIFPLTPMPPTTCNAPVVEDVELVLLFIVTEPMACTVDLNVAAPVTPNPAATSKVEPIIVAPEILPVPMTVKVEAAVKAPLKVLAPANV